MSVFRVSPCSNTKQIRLYCIEDEVGEGAALSISTCDLSFDGQGGCSVNDTDFAYSHAGRKGGAVSIGSGQSPSHVEFHRCRVDKSTAGKYIEDDPQGDGGAFNLAAGTRLLLSDSAFIDNYCGNKVSIKRVAIKVKSSSIMPFLFYLFCFFFSIFQTPETVL